MSSFPRPGTSRGSRLLAVITPGDSEIRRHNYKLEDGDKSGHCYKHNREIRETKPAPREAKINFLSFIFWSLIEFYIDTRKEII